MFSDDYPGKILNRDSDLPVPTSFLKAKSNLGGKGSHSLKLETGNKFSSFARILSKQESDVNKIDVFSDENSLAAKVEQFKYAGCGSVGEQETPTPGVGGPHKKISTQLTFGTGGSDSNNMPTELQNILAKKPPEPVPVTSKKASNESPNAPVSQQSDDLKAALRRKLIDASMPMID